MDTEKFTQELADIEANLKTRYTIRDIDSFCKAMTGTQDAPDFESFSRYSIRRDAFAKYGNLIRIGKDLQVYHMPDKDEEYVHIIYKHAGGTLNNIYIKSHEAKRNPSKLFWLAIYDSIAEETKALTEAPKQEATPSAPAQKSTRQLDLKKTLENFRLYGNL